MKRTRSFMEEQENAGSGLGATSLSTGALPSYQQTGVVRGAPLDLMSLSHLPTPLSNRDGALLGADHVKDSSDVATVSSRGAWNAEQLADHEGKHNCHVHDGNMLPATIIKQENGALPEQTVIHRVGSSDKLTLKDVACGPVDVMAERMRAQPDEVSEELKAELREILNGTGGISQQRDEFINLQNVVLSRRDLLPETLMQADRNQLQILVAIKTGIPVFLLPNVSVTQSILTDVFFHKKCRNMACQSQLPGDDCTCEVCSTKSGFCNVCMCTICNKFDFEVNTCRWIGCDVCSHWTHTDCARRVGQVVMGLSANGSSLQGMVFNCRACKHTSELLGWVKDVFNNCAADWEVAEIGKEVDCVHRLFLGSEDAKGKRLFRKTEEFLEKLKNGVNGRVVCTEMQCFFQELEAEDLEEGRAEDTKMIEPQDACNRIAAVVREAVAKMDTVAQEKSRALKRARLAVETSAKELEEKKRELQVLQLERQRKKEDIEELETILKLRLAESDMFQERANEARAMADELQQMVTEKSEKAEQEFTARYLQRRLSEVEAQRRALFEKIQQQDSKSQQNPLPMAKIDDLLKRAYSQKEFCDIKETSGSGL